MALLDYRQEQVKELTAMQRKLESTRCPYNAKRKHGSIWDVDDRFCIHAKKTLEWLIWDLFTTKIEPEINRKLQLRGDNNGVT